LEFFLDDTQAPLSLEIAVNRTGKWSFDTAWRALGCVLGSSCALLASTTALAQSHSGPAPYDNTSFSNPYAPGGPYDPYRYQHQARDPYGLYGGASANGASGASGEAANSSARRARSRRLKERALAGAATAAGGTQANALRSPGSAQMTNALDPGRDLNRSQAGDGRCAAPAFPSLAARSARGGSRDANPGNDACGARGQYPRSR
jgi:hypothetical protein